MGFFKRWQQRREQVAEQAEIEAKQATAATPSTAEAEALESASTEDLDASPTTDAAPEPNSETAELSLPDPSQIEQGGSFADFMQPGVDPSVRKQALKSLWSQPQYNQLDGLTDYHYDYSKQQSLDSETAAELTKKLFRHSKQRVEEASEEAALAETNSVPNDEVRAEQLSSTPDLMADADAPITDATDKPVANPQSRN